MAPSAPLAPVSSGNWRAQSTGGTLLPSRMPAPLSSVHPPAVFDNNIYYYLLRAYCLCKAFLLNEAFFLYELIQFNKYLLSTYYVPGTVLGAEDTEGNNTKVPTLMELII